MAIVPTHNIRRRTVVAEHLEDFSITLGFAHVMPPDDESIAKAGP
jgi:hypothetical protein